MTPTLNRAIRAAQSAIKRLATNQSAPGIRRAWRDLLEALKRIRKHAAAMRPIPKRAPKPRRKRPKPAGRWASLSPVPLGTVTSHRLSTCGFAGVPVQGSSMRLSFPTWAVTLINSRVCTNTQLRQARRSITLREMLLAAAALSSKETT